MTECPRCGVIGRGIERVTLEAQVDSRTLAGIPMRSGWLFCGASRCAAVYFRGDEVVGLEALKRLPFQKSTSPERLVCFCFGHSVADLGGPDATSIRHSIKMECNAGRDRCALENPQGRCCLGNVGQVMREASGSPAAAAVCCKEDSKNTRWTL